MNAKTTLVFFLTLLTTSIWAAHVDAADDAKQPQKPRVLILGDSISIGYTPIVREMLADDAVVLRAVNAKGRTENCAGTNHGVKNIDRWLAIDGGRWDVIHFNFGLHDLKRINGETGGNSNDPNDPYQASPKQYERQLREIVGKLKKTDAKLIWATTTPVPAGGVRPHRGVDDPLIYNAIAKRVMSENKIPTNDLFAVATTKQDQIQRSNNVHFSKEGSQLLAAAVVTHIRGALAGEAKESIRPNIVFIMVDDMGWSDLGCFGSKAIQTPHLDRMAAQGIRFTQAYSGCTVCAPARSVLMTGRHMGHTSVRGNTGGIPLLDEDVTIAEVLQLAGYATGGFGKWGIGDIGTTGAAEKQGFDTFFGYYHQIHAHYYYPDYLIDTGEKFSLPGNRGFYQQKPGVGFFPTKDPKTGLDRQFSQYLIAERALQFIRDNRDGPFFCYMPLTAPHGRYEMPADDPAVAMYADEPWSKTAKVIAAMDTMIDRQVGQVLDLLKELNIDDDTLVMFCSDHGAAARMDGELDSCGPLRGFKRSMYEGGLRTPMIARWPGRAKAGTVSTHQCYFGDMMATFADLAQANEYLPEQTDSVSLAATLTGNADAQPRHEYLYWEWPTYNWTKHEYQGMMQAVRAGDWKLVRADNTKPWQLYDLASDIGEQHDLAGKHADVVARLDKMATQAHVDPRPQAEPKMPAGQRYR